MKNKTIIPDRVFFRIGDVADILKIKPYVIRFWEGEFPFLAPEKSTTGQRVYRKAQIEGLILVQHLLHVERYSIEGAKKKLTELRKQAKLKDAMMELVQTGELHLDEMPATESKSKVKIGSKVPKENIASLREKVSELQTLIRKPETLGLEVPKLDTAE